MKNKYGVELGGSVGRLGYDGRFIDVQVDFLTAKFFFIYEDGKLKIDSGFGWDTDLGNGLTKTAGFTVGVNTGFLVAVICWIYKLVTTSDPSSVPGLQPAY